MCPQAARATSGSPLHLFKSVGGSGVAAVFFSPSVAPRRSRKWLCEVSQARSLLSVPKTHSDPLCPCRVSSAEFQPLSLPLSLCLSLSLCLLLTHLKVCAPGCASQIFLQSPPTPNLSPGSMNSVKLSLSNILCTWSPGPAAEEETQSPRLRDLQSTTWVVRTTELLQELLTAVAFTTTTKGARFFCGNYNHIYYVLGDFFLAQFGRCGAMVRRAGQRSRPSIPCGKTARTGFLFPFSLTHSRPIWGLAPESCATRRFLRGAMTVQGLITYNTRREAMSNHEILLGPGDAKARSSPPLSPHRKLNSTLWISLKGRMVKLPTISYY